MSAMRREEARSDLAYPVLEIDLTEATPGVCHVDLRFVPPGRVTDARPLRDGLLSVPIDQDRLRALPLDPEAYGRLLTQTLFAPREVIEALNVAQTSAATAGCSLRLRLFIRP